MATWKPKFIKSVWQMTESERHEARLQIEKENLEIKKENEVALWEEIHGCLSGCMNIALLSGLPVENILVFATQSYPFSCIYNGKEFVIPECWWGSSELYRGSSVRTRLAIDYFHKFIENRCAEIPEYPCGLAIFGLLWFDSLDHAQQLIGFSVPWITLGYWRREDHYAERSKGKFYRLWLTSEKQEIKQKRSQR